MCIRDSLRKRFKAAWLRNEWGKPVMYTFTFRTKDKYETWDMFRYRTGAKTEAPEQRLEWPRKGLHLPTLTFARAHFSNKQWQRYLTAFFQRLGLYYRRRWGEDLVYLAVPEYTKQGTPHIHMLVPEEFVTGQDRWMIKMWTTFAPDSYQVHVSRGQHAIGEGLHYVLSYAAKEMLSVKGMRRYRYGGDWNLPAMGMRDAFRWVDWMTGEIKFFDRKLWERLRGKWYYYHETEARTMPKVQEKDYLIMALRSSNKLLKANYIRKDKAEADDLSWSIDGEPQQVLVYGEKEIEFIPRSPEIWT